MNGLDSPDWPRCPNCKCQQVKLGDEIKRLQSRLDLQAPIVARAKEVFEDFSKDEVQTMTTNIRILWAEVESYLVALDKLGEKS